MKPIIIFIALLMVTVNISAELKIIENYAVPQDKNAGRVLALEEIMRISDESGDFYFKRPRKIRIAPDESIFLVDKDQFLRFDKNGKFLNNQQKKGEGPGEYSFIRSYQFSGNKVIILSSQPGKIIETDMKGNLVKEQRLIDQLGANQIFGFIGDKYWFAALSYQELFKGNTGEYTLPQELSWSTRNEKVKKTGISFPLKLYVGKDGSMRIVAQPVFACDQVSTLYASDARKYLIRQVDLEKVKIIRIFTRKYTRVPYKDERSKEERDKEGPIEGDPEYFSDIQGLYVRKDKIWAVTSTLVKEKGVLVDVFTKEGKYKDNFYLPLPGVTKVSHLEGETFVLYKDFLFTVESDEDGNREVVKYRIKI